jgi:hypothetical protein
MVGQPNSSDGHAHVLSPDSEDIQEQRRLGGSGGRGERLALLDHVGRREDRLRRPVLATVRHSRRHLKSLARREGVRALAVNRKVEPAFNEIARLDARMGVARDDGVRLDVNPHLHSDVAVCRAIGLLDEGAFEAGRDGGFSFRSGRRQRSPRIVRRRRKRVVSASVSPPLRRAALAWLFFPKSAGRLPFE